MAQDTARSQPQRATTIDFPEVRHRSRKEEAFAQLKKHNVPEILEEVLNKACRVQPDDLFGYMSDYFHSLSKEPVISSLVAVEGLDSSGGRSVEIDLYCTVCGMEKLMAKSAISVESFRSSSFLAESVTSSTIGTPKKGSPGPGGAGGSKKKAASRGGSPSPAFGSTHSVTDSKVYLTGVTSMNIRKIDFLETIRAEISRSLVGLHVGKQHEIDKVLEDLRSKAAADKVRLHPNAMLAISCAAASAGSQLTSLPLFLYLSSTRIHFQPAIPSGSLQMGPCSLIVDMYDGKENGTQYIKVDPHLSSHSSRRASLSAPQFPPSRPPQKFTVPLPVVSALGQGSGKLKVREFCVCPLPGSSVLQQIRMIQKLYYDLGKCAVAKMGPAARVPHLSGAYSPPLDKLDQGLDLIKEATISGGFQLGTDVAVLIDIGAESLYDEDKGKYEMVAGQWKSTDDFINMLSDTLNNPNFGIIGFIDPLHHKDVAGWKKLVARLGSRGLIIANGALQRGLHLVQRKAHSPSRRMSLQDTEDLISVKSDRGEGGSGKSEDEGVEGVSCAVLTWEHTLSNTIDKADQLKGSCQYVMMAVPHSLTINTTIADLAVAAHCQYIRLGAPKGCTTLLLNRLLRIFEELSSRKLYEPVQPIVFASDAQQ